jgi:hypothetical protein
MTPVTYSLRSGCGRGPGTNVNHKVLVSSLFYPLSGRLMLTVQMEAHSIIAYSYSNSSPQEYEMIGMNPDCKVTVNVPPP